MSIGYVSAPPGDGTYISQGFLHTAASRHAAVGDLHVSPGWRSWHRQGTKPSWAGNRYGDGVLWTRCGKRIGFEWGGTMVDLVIATTDDPGDAACARCERRPGGDRRFRQLLEQAYQVTMAVAAARGLEADPSEVRRLVALEVLRRDDHLR